MTFNTYGYDMCDMSMTLHSLRCVTSILTTHCADPQDKLNSGSLEELSLDGEVCCQATVVPYALISCDYCTSYGLHPKGFYPLTREPVLLLMARSILLDCAAVLKDLTVSLRIGQGIGQKLLLIGTSHTFVPSACYASCTVKCAPLCVVHSTGQCGVSAVSLCIKSYFRSLHRHFGSKLTW